MATVPTITGDVPAVRDPFRFKVRMGRWIDVLGVEWTEVSFPLVNQESAITRGNVLNAPKKTNSKIEDWSRFVKLRRLDASGPGRADNRSAPVNKHSAAVPVDRSAASWESDARNAEVVAVRRTHTVRITLATRRT